MEEKRSRDSGGGAGVDGRWRRIVVVLAEDGED